jgi:PAS domain S-box-containing protein
MNNVLVKFNQIGEILDYLSLGVIVLSLDRKIISINRSAEMLTGRHREDVIGSYCYKEFLNYLCGGECKYLKNRHKGNSEICPELEITDQPHGSYSITKIQAPYYGSNNQIQGLIEIFQDHSVFKELIQRIRYDDQRLKIILDNLDLGILTVDRGSHITFFNTLAENITGYNRSKVLGKSCTTIFRHDFCRDIIQLKESMDDVDAPTSLETELITSEGQRLPIRANCLALKNEKGIVVGGLTTFTDLSLKYQFKSAIKDRYTFYDMVGKDPTMQQIFDTIPIVAVSDATILIEGPTGTGKDLLAKIIHNASPRAKNAFVKVNCAALPDNLLESEMFGYVKGAFTGADRDKPGRFQLADKGTIFLDEIGDLPLSLQAKLLRVLEDREFYPLGGRHTSKVNVRIIAATNRKLEQLVQEKRFREDLFYRLNVMCLELPPLSHRSVDIPLLVSHILRRLRATRDTQVDQISEDAMQILLNHDYPGNVRELENILEHALIICQERTVQQEHLPVYLLKKQASVTEKPPQPLPLTQELGEGEKRMIWETLKQHQWRRGETAQALGINRSTLWRKMKKYNLA